MAPSHLPSRGAVNWETLRQRMEAAGRDLEGATRLSAEAARELLETRARLLARPVAARDVGKILELVTFSLAGETYAIESRYVLAVFKLVDLSRLPGAEAPVFGVTAWRGELLTIVDLRAALGRPVAALNDLGQVIVLGEDRPAFGVLADAVLEVIPLAASEVRALPDGLASGRDLLRGVTAGAVLLLGGERLLRLLGPDPPAAGADT